MRQLVVIAILLSLASCVDDARVPVRDPVSIDVILDDDLASIYVRPLGREAYCSFNPVLDGVCGTVSTDRIGCLFLDDDGPANRNSVYGCAEELRLGSTIAEDAAYDESNASGVLFGVVGNDRTLTVVGCGDDIVVPLDVVDAPPVGVATTLERVKGGERAFAFVEAEGASHARICENSFFTTECCDSAPGLIDIPYSARRGSSYPISIETLAGPVTTTTRDGVIVRVWRRTVAPLPSVSGVPEPREFGRWQSRVGINGGELGSFNRVVFDARDATRFTLEPEYGVATTVTLSRDVDTAHMRMFDTNGAVLTYVGVVPHDPIDRALPIGTFDELVIDVDHGDVVFTNVDDASNTITAPLRLQGTIHGIPRP